MTSIVVIDSGVNLPGLLYLAQPFTMNKSFTSVLSFLICKMGMLTESTSLDCYRD